MISVTVEIRGTWSEEWLRQFSEQPMAAPDGEEQGMT